MPKNLLLSFLAVGLTFTGVASASTLAVSTSGSFGTADTVTSLTAPGASWAFSFNVNSQPVTSNTLASSFDVAFSNFNYKLNGTSVSETPSSIRFYDGSSQGLFTVFFGPESGILNNGNYTPEFSLYGPQLYTGTIASPTLLAGSFPVSESIFSDMANYDDQVSPGSFALVSAVTTPEPATLGLLSVALMFAGALRFWRSRSESMR